VRLSGTDRRGLGALCGHGSYWLKGIIFSLTPES
jgi:hypothetical protein